MFPPDPGGFQLIIYELLLLRFSSGLVQKPRREMAPAGDRQPPCLSEI